MNGKQIPAIVTSVRDATHVRLVTRLRMVARGGDIELRERDNGPEQWQPKPEKHR